MADPISTLAIDNTQEYAIVAPVECNRIEVRENFDSATAPTADLIQAIPKGSATPIKIPKGTSAIYTKRAYYSAGEVAGSIKTSSGSITVAVIASSQI